MISILVVTSVVLIAAILFLLFRSQILLSVMKREYTEKVSKSNGLNAALFAISVIVMLGMFFWYSNEAKEFFLPKAASEHGVITDNWFWIDMAIIFFPFIICQVLMAWFVFRYKYKEENKAYFYPDNHKLELLWTVVPAIVLTVLVISGWIVWTDITNPPSKDAEVIEVMAKQFAWQVRYPGKDKKLGHYDFRNIDAINEFGLDFSDKANLDDFIPRELHFPKGKEVFLKIRSRDVLHSVFLPHFRVKMDAVPGMITQFKFVPTITTKEMREKLGKPNFNYEMACTEVCGRGHFAMKFIVVVDEPEDYDKWYASQEPWVNQNPEYLTKAGASK